MRKKTLFVLILILLKTTLGYSQSSIPTIKAKSNKASVRLGKQYYPDAWEITPKPQNDPEMFGTEVPKEGLLIGVITDIDSISFLVKQGEIYKFRVILNEKDTVWAAANGRYPKGNFDENYKKTHEGKTFVEVPPVYELINIIMAITPTGVRDSNLIEHNIDYYTKVQTYFSPFKTHKAVLLMDSLLKADHYYDNKMDAYSFDLVKGVLKKKPEYNRVGWGNENTLEAYVKPIQDFAKVSKFERFYKQNKPFYESMIRAYRDSLGVIDMQNWLNKNFPATRYNCFKIIFSPLVSGNQSATDFESNGFKEAQAHVNFPDNPYNPKTMKYSFKAYNVTRGDIVFTELNHNFENPEFENEQNSALINRFSYNLAVYATKGKAASFYNSTLSNIEEYMNWALVSLRYVDFAPKEDLEALLQMREHFMVDYRGFTKFKEFQRFLVDIYQKRPQGTVVADLYPQIIKWFKDNNK
jgi:Domain of unknown function (DUF4932)